MSMGLEVRSYTSVVCIVASYSLKGHVVTVVSHHKRHNLFITRHPQCFSFFVDKQSDVATYIVAT